MKLSPENPFGGGRGGELDNFASLGASRPRSPPEAKPPHSPHSHFSSSPHGGPFGGGGQSSRGSSRPPPRSRAPPPHFPSEDSRSSFKPPQGDPFKANYRPEFQDHFKGSRIPSGFQECHSVVTRDFSLAK